MPDELQCCTGVVANATDTASRDSGTVWPHQVKALASKKLRPSAGGTDGGQSKVTNELRRQYLRCKRDSRLSRYRSANRARTRDGSTPGQQGHEDERSSHYNPRSWMPNTQVHLQRNIQNASAASVPKIARQVQRTLCDHHSDAGLISARDTAGRRRPMHAPCTQPVPLRSWAEVPLVRPPPSVQSTCQPPPSQLALVA